MHSELARATAAVASPGLDLEAGAVAGSSRVANASMERAMRAVSVERGSIFSRSRSSTACKIPVSLGITQVLVPQFAGALSALGLLLADNVRDAAGVLGRTDYEAGFATLESQAGTLRRPELRTHPPALNSSPNPSPPRTKKCTVMAYPADSSRSSPYASGPSSRWSSRSSATPAADAADGLLIAADR